MVYVIIVYDVNVSRVNKVKAYLRQRLNWVQNSVFEGEVTKAKLEEIKWELKEIINKEEDSIIIYYFRTKPEVKKEILGIEKNSLDQIL